VNLLGDNVDNIKENTIGASKEVGLELKVGKPKYMLLSRQHNASQNPDIMVANRSFEIVAQLKYFGTKLRS
jgi:hypothetical protein